MLSDAPRAYSYSVNHMHAQVRRVTSPARYEGTRAESRRKLPRRARPMAKYGVLSPSDRHSDDSENSFESNPWTKNSKGTRVLPKRHARQAARNAVRACSAHDNSDENFDATSTEAEGSSDAGAQIDTSRKAARGKAAGRRIVHSTESNESDVLYPNGQMHESSVSSASSSAAREKADNEERISDSGSDRIDLIYKPHTSWASHRQHPRRLRKRRLIANSNSNRSKGVATSEEHSDELEMPRNRRSKRPAVQSSATSGDETDRVHKNTTKKHKKYTNGRRQIRSVISDEDLNRETQNAQRIERERLARIAARIRNPSRNSPASSDLEAIPAPPNLQVAEGLEPDADIHSGEDDIPSSTNSRARSDRSGSESANGVSGANEESTEDLYESSSYSELFESSEYEEETEDSHSEWDEEEWEWECAQYNSQFFDAEFAFTSDNDDDENRLSIKKIMQSVYRPRINIHSPEGEPIIRVPKHLAKILKQHQLDGIRFMWQNTVETLELYEATKWEGFGCILAHAMGLGKTIQVITFLYCFLRYTSATRALVIVPVNTVENWKREVAKWLPRRHRPFTAVISGSWKRSDDLTEWKRVGGILIVGYETFRAIVTYSGSNKAVKDAMADILNADIVICDEGHRIKNNMSGVSKALAYLKTRRRICLTGSPLQNNLIEYWCMIDFVRPKLLGTQREFANRFANPIKNGSCVNSTAEDAKICRFRSHVLHNIIRGFVHRRTLSIFANTLPTKHEFVVHCRLSPLQENIYRDFIKLSETAPQANGVLTMFALFSKIWNHPDVLRKAVFTALDTFLLEQQNLPATKPLDTLISQLKEMRDGSGPFISEEAVCRFASLCEDAGVDQIPAKQRKLNDLDACEENARFTPSTLRIMRKLLAKSYEECCLQHSGKFKVAFSLIDHAFSEKDKIVIFSQSIATLDSFEALLNNGHLRKSRWRLGSHYYRIDGQTRMKDRQTMIAEFNKKSNKKVRIFLVSTRAGGIGINLVGANRVIVLDSSWNPSHDLQAVSRVYRYGQLKETYLYRIIAAGTMESKIYDRQILKTSMSNRVVDKMQQKRVLDLQELSELMEYKPSEQLPTKGELLSSAPAHMDKVLCKMLSECPSVMDKAPQLHDCLLEDDPTANMTPEEIAEAKKDYDGMINSEHVHELASTMNRQSSSSTPNSTAAPKPAIKPTSKPTSPKKSLASTIYRQASNSTPNPIAAPKPAIKSTSKPASPRKSFSAVDWGVRVIPTMPLPKNWHQAKHILSGDFYYYNRSTGEVQWERPSFVKNSLSPQSPKTLGTTGATYF